ncbi:MAG TPA: aminotransferase class V-fold PLP-dependent enzyme, partial [Balneolaceae bacterium]|nr:aminotransferase class V-fold PLP-dependent enzyme [Balneolaceae bacterium]
ENMCIRWLCDLIGYGESAGGNLTSGGSMANLIGLVTARDDAKIEAKDFHRAVIYTTRQVHHCVIKALKFAGLGEANLREIPMDERYRMKPENLRRQVEADKENGLIPLVIFASAGTTDIGAVDPLNDIADIAEEHNLWFHVDAAYGGFFLLTEHGKETMKGIERSDSVTIDPHKGLFLPYGSGAVLVRDEQKLFDSQHMTANYLQDTYKANEQRSPADLSPELSKHFRGLRMWLPLQLFGIKPIRAALDEKLLLTRYFYEEVQQIDGIEVGPKPELSVMFFRYKPKTGDANDFNKKLVEEMHADGRVFLSSTHINGTVYLRLAVLSFRTHLEEIDLTLSILRQTIQKLTQA